MDLSRIDENSKCPIQPEHIDTNRHFWNAFNKSETETEARVLVMNAQRTNTWAPIKKAELVYSSGKPFTPHFIREWIIEEDDAVCFTHQFISRCYQSSPVQ